MPNNKEQPQEEPWYWHPDGPEAFAELQALEEAYEDDDE